MQKIYLLSRSVEGHQKMWLSASTARGEVMAVLDVLESRVDLAKLIGMFPPYYPEPEIEEIAEVRSESFKRAERNHDHFRESRGY